MTRNLFLLLALVFAAATVQAQNPLTGNQVERFLNTLEKLNELPDLSSKTTPDPMQMTAEELEAKMRSPFQSSIPEMRDHEDFSRALAIMRSEGFGDETEWAVVGDRVMRAFAALKMEEVEPDLDDEMAQALAELEKSELPEEMKEKMRDAMKVAKGMAQTIDDVPPGDVDALRPHMERFEMIAQTSAQKHVR